MGEKNIVCHSISEVERQRWVTALELAKAQALRARGMLPGSNSEDEDDVGAGGDADGGGQEITKQELDNVVKTLSVRLEDLITCTSLIGEK
jgi:hypothetical protein